MSKNILLEVEGEQVLMEVDTGACTIIMHKEEYLKYFSTKKLDKIDNSLKTISGLNA